MTLECPKCKSPVAREGQKFCYRCGQELSAYYKSLNIEVKDSGSLWEAERASAPVESPPQSSEMAAPASGTEVAHTMVLGSAPTDIQTAGVAPAPAPKQQARLVIVLPTGDVFDREIVATETQMGKGPRNDIVIADPAVSTAHAVIRGDGNTYTITDLGSRNGTSVNSERLAAPRELHHGDIIGIGLSKLTFRLTDYSETGSIPAPETTLAIQRSAVPLLTEDALANALVAANLVAQGNLDRVRGAETRGRRLCTALVEENLVSEDALRDVMSRAFQIPIIDLKSEPPDSAIATKFPPQLARDRQLLAVRQDGENLLLAVADPTDTEAVEEAKRAMQMPVTLRLAMASQILEQVDRLFGPRLIGVLPSGAKFEYFISKGEIEIGKAAHNHIVLQDPTVSNTHAILMAREGGYSVIDLGSRNGTYINGERLGARAHTLRHGDTIQLGQTVLTFRNRAETTANVTATLSPDALAEIRERAASLDTSAEQTLPTNEAASAPPVVASLIDANPAAVPVMAESDDEKGDKKKKKKKKKGGDDRLKAAYIGGLSRILAQVLAVMLSVGLALYLTYRNTDKPVVETNTKGKAKVKIGSPGAGTPFKGGVFEASGVVQAPGVEGIYFIDDSKPGEILWMQLDQSGNQVGEQVKPIDFGASVADPEGITYDGSFFYVISSQSHAQAGERNALVRFALDVTAQTVQGQAEVMVNLRDYLVKNVPELAAVSDKEGKAGGLNVEGLAWDIANGRLLLGLRSPLVNGHALVVPLKLRDPRGPFTTDNLLPPGPPIQLALGGLGIRDLQYDTRAGQFLIITGAPASGDTPSFSLWEWNGDTDSSKPEATPREISKLDAKMKPEGVTRVKLGGHDFIVIVGDGSSYMKLDIAESQ